MQDGDILETARNEKDLNTISDKDLKLHNDHNATTAVKKANSVFSFLERRNARK